MTAAYGSPAALRYRNGDDQHIYLFVKALAY
jgi:hypothetical protein